MCVLNTLRAMGSLELSAVNIKDLEMGYIGIKATKMAIFWLGKKNYKGQPNYQVYKTSFLREQFLPELSLHLCWVP